MCTSIAIVEDDDTTEPQETFSFQLASEHPGIEIDISDAVVTITRDPTMGTSVLEKYCCTYCDPAL